jgi:hypothetical protein
MNYKFGWEATPEVKRAWQHDAEMKEQHRKEALREKRKELALIVFIGVCVFLYQVAPLIFRGA